MITLHLTKDPFFAILTTSYTKDYSKGPARTVKIMVCHKKGLETSTNDSLSSTQIVILFGYKIQMPSSTINRGKIVFLKHVVTTQELQEGLNNFILDIKE